MQGMNTAHLSACLLCLLCARCACCRYGEDAAEVSVQGMNTAGYSADAVYSGGPGPAPALCLGCAWAPPGPCLGSLHVHVPACQPIPRDGGCAVMCWHFNQS